MAARSIASLSLSFGLVHIPVKLYTATESSSAIRFNMLSKDGSRVKQQYVSEKDGKVVERSEMVKGYEFEKDQFVTFSPEEMKALEQAASHIVQIVSFVPEKSVDPIFYEKAYLLAPDKRGGKPYALLKQALRETGRCALAQWASKGKEYVVQIRAVEDGLVLQQLLYAEEVRSLRDLDIEQAEVTAAEMSLATQLIDQASQDAYDATLFKDHEKERMLAAIDHKIAGKEVVMAAPKGDVASGQVIDLMEALRASLGKNAASATEKAPAKRASAKAVDMVSALAERKGTRRAPDIEEPVAPPAKVRARK